MTEPDFCLEKLQQIYIAHVMGKSMKNILKEQGKKMSTLREKIDYLTDLENPWIQAVEDAAEDVCDLENYMGKWRYQYPKMELPDGYILTFRPHNLKVRLVREDPLTFEYKVWNEVKLKQRFECIPYIEKLVDKIIEQTRSRGGDHV